MAKSAKRKTHDAVTTIAGRSSKPLPHLAVPVTDSEIARRAYNLYVARGREHGYDVEDWLQAERELQGAVRPDAALTSGATSRAPRRIR